MTLSKKTIAAAAISLLIGVPAAADAQRRGGGGQGRGSNGGGPRAVPRASAPRSGGGAPRAQSPSRGGYMAPRSYSSRQYSYGGSRGYGAGFRGGMVAGRSLPRANGFRGFGGAPARFYRPYYSFRPSLSLGFGLWVGSPIIYPYSHGYYDPYGYSYSNPYPSTSYPAYPPSAYPRSVYPRSVYPQSAYPRSVYPRSVYPQSAYPQSAYPQSVYPQSAYPPASGSVGVQPGQYQANTGGVSFEIAPSTAQVFVDGSPVGTVGDFTPTTQPLGLTPGRHRIEIRAPGYQTMGFDADIVEGQVLPYQGTMQR